MKSEDIEQNQRERSLLSNLINNDDSGQILGGTIQLRSIIEEISVRGLTNLNLIGDLNHILSLLDRDPLSATFGCFDKEFWHYKRSAFLNSMMQNYMYSLSLYLKLIIGGYRGHLTSNPNSNSNSNSNPNSNSIPNLNTNSNLDSNSRRKLKLMEDFRRQILKRVDLKLLLYLIKGSIEYTLQNIHRDGSIDEHYRYERSHVANSFIIISLFQTIKILKEAGTSIKFKGQLKNNIDKLLEWALKNREKEIIGNHWAGHILALLYSFKYSSDPRFFKAALKELERLELIQSREGWISEYGGCDVGYLTLTLSFLADILAELIELRGSKIKLKLKSAKNFDYEKYQRDLVIFEKILGNIIGRVIDFFRDIYISDLGFHSLNWSRKNHHFFINGYLQILILVLKNEYTMRGDRIETILKYIIGYFNNIFLDVGLYNEVENHNQNAMHNNNSNNNNNDSKDYISDISHISMDITLEELNDDRFLFLGVNDKLLEVLNIIELIDVLPNKELKGVIKSWSSLKIKKIQEPQQPQQPQQPQNEFKIKLFREAGVIKLSKGEDYGFISYGLRNAIYLRFQNPSNRDKHLSIIDTGIGVGLKNGRYYISYILENPMVILLPSVKNNYGVQNEEEDMKNKKTGGKLKLNKIKSEVPEEPRIMGIKKVSSQSQKPKAKIKIKIIIIGRMHLLRKRRLTLLNQIMLNMASMTLLKSPVISRIIKKMFIGKMITRSNPIKIKFKRNGDISIKGTPFIMNQMYYDQNSHQNSEQNNNIKSNGDYNNETNNKFNIDNITNRNLDTLIKIYTKNRWKDKHHAGIKTKLSRLLYKHKINKGPIYYKEVDISGAMDDIKIGEVILFKRTSRQAQNIKNFILTRGVNPLYIPSSEYFGKLEYLPYELMDYSAIRVDKGKKYWKFIIKRQVNKGN